MAEEPLVGHGTNEVDSMAVEPAMAHPGVSQGKSVAILATVGKVAAVGTAIQIKGAALYHTAAGDEAVHNILVGSRGSELKADGATVAEAAAAQVEPVEGVYRQLVVIKGEDNK